MKSRKEAPITSPNSQINILGAKRGSVSHRNAQTGLQFSGVHGDRGLQPCKTGRGLEFGSTASVANFSDLEQQMKFINNTEKTSRVLKTKDLPLPHGIDQMVIKKRESEDKRFVLSHRELIKGLTRSSYSSSYNLNGQQNTAQKNRQSAGVLNTKTASEAGIVSVKTMVESQGSLIEKNSQQPQGHRPLTARESGKLFQKQRTMTAHQRMIQNRFKQRQALF